LLAQRLKRVLVKRQLAFVHALLKFFLGILYGDAAHMTEIGAVHDRGLANRTFFHRMILAGGLMLAGSLMELIDKP
jgi:hypothetical protein